MSPEPDAEGNKDKYNCTGLTYYKRSVGGSEQWNKSISHIANIFEQKQDNVIIFSKW
jgi:hypothetical protein